MPKVQGTAMVDELVLLYRGMGQHDKALEVRCAPFAGTFAVAYIIAPLVAALYTTLIAVHWSHESITGDCQQAYEGVRPGGKAILP